MTDFRYAQFCPLARATEIVGERWTLLIVRELVLGPKRFSDFEAPLSGISSSVLADRLTRLEARGIVKRRELPPPTPATVYELDEAGRALLPVVVELSRWGARFLETPEAGDYVDPGWVQLAAIVFGRREATPPRLFQVTAQGEGHELTFCLRGGPDGTALDDSGAEADASISAPTLVLMGLASGALDPAAAARSGALAVEGNLDALVDFPALFDMQPPHNPGD